MNDQSKNILKKKSLNYPGWVLTERQSCDLEMILNGGFFPLNGFLELDDYESVVNNLRLSDGTVWPIPITLDITSEFADSVSEGDSITLKDKEGFSLAVMRITNIWEPDRKKESKLVFGTDDDSHPGADYLLNEGNSVYVGGPVEGIDLPHHYDYQILRYTPDMLKKKFQELGWNKVVAFQTRNPMN